MTTIPEGPWTNEPDHEQWTDPETGLPCLIRRAPAGHLCGYVAVPESHPWHGATIWDVDADVHGGISWSGRGTANIGWRGDGDPARHWWVGFDAGHLGDLVPGLLARELGLSSDVYRDMRFMRAEVASLVALTAKQSATA